MAAFVCKCSSSCLESGGKSSVAKLATVPGDRLPTGAEDAIFNPTALSAARTAAAHEYVASLPSGLRHFATLSRNSTVHNCGHLVGEKGSRKMASARTPDSTTCPIV